MLKDWKNLICLHFERCHSCFRKEDRVDVVKDRIENIVCEIQSNCRHCGAVLDYWAYGAYESSYERHILEQENPKLAWILHKVRKVTP